MQDDRETKTTSTRDMSPDERLAWLRERGVTVETSEDRRRKKITRIKDDGEEFDNVSFVHIPQDKSLPLKDLTMKVSKSETGKGGDLLMDYLRPFFSAFDEKLDLDLLKEQTSKHFGSTDSPGEVSEKSLRDVAAQGQVETFCLVNPVPSNKFITVNIYLDEVGMLKRLPLNSRAGDMALRAGYNPSPQFYGNVFIGRLSIKPVMKNVDFKLGLDTSPDAKWLQLATMQNLEYQTALNKISSNPDQVQPSADGEDGIAKTENGGLYSWTQTDEEIEITIPLKFVDGQDVVTTKDVKVRGLKVKYYPRKLLVSFQGKELLTLRFFAGVDTDGCWTLDTNKKDVSVIITCEKIDPLLWPRIME